MFEWGLKPAANIVAVTTLRNSYMYLILKLDSELLRS